MEAQKEIERILHQLKYDLKTAIPSTIPVYNKTIHIANLRVITKKSLSKPETISLLAKWRAASQDAFPSQFKVTHEGTKKWSKNQLLELPDRILFFLETLDGEPYAHMGLFRFNYKEQSCEIDNVVRGEDIIPGSMTHALHALIEWTFMYLPLKTLYLEVFADNTRAIKLYRRTGFKNVKKIPLKKIIEPNATKFIEIVNSKEDADRYFLMMKLQGQNKTMKNNTEQLKLKANNLRKVILSMIVNARASHIGSAYSVLDILIYLYDRVLKIDPTNPLENNRDRFILSKGWGVAALYSVLAEKGFFDKKLLLEYCKDGSKMIGIATKNGIPGIEATTGSMGHGLPIGIGMALAGKIQKQDYRVFVVISDGECDEGSTWEAILQAGHYQLDNLVVIVDYNKWQSFGRTTDVLDLEPMTTKWESFNWTVKETDGHDFAAMEKALSKIPFKKGKPSVLIAHTTKGKGVSVLENRNEWHYKTPSEAELLLAEEELS
jgi:transketolase